MVDQVRAWYYRNEADLTPNPGICYCFVKRAADSGAKVLIADLALIDEAQKLVDSSKNVKFQKTDVTKWDQLKSIVTVCRDHFGSTPDVYVAGAGVFEPV